MRKIIKYLVFMTVFFTMQLDSQSQSWKMNFDSTTFYQKKEDFESALIWIRQAIPAAAKEYGTLSENYMKSLGTISEIFYFLNSNDSAEFYENEKLILCRKLYNKENFETATSINNMAFYNDMKGNYKQAEKLYNEALAMYRRLFKMDNQDLANCINNLAVFYFDRGKYRQAEPLYLESLKMYKSLFKGNNPELARIINNMGMFYNAIGDHENAEIFYKEALAMYRFIYSGNNRDLAITINNMGKFYFVNEDYQNAELLLKESLEMKRQLYKANHPDLANSLNSMATLYKATGNFSKAEGLFNESLDMYKRLFKTDHSDLANSLNNVGLFYLDNGDFQKAESLLSESLNMRRRIFNSDHPDLAVSLKNMISLYELTNNFKKAVDLYDEIFKVNENIIANFFPSLSETEKEKFLTTINKYYNAFHSFICNENLADDKSLTKEYNRALEQDYNNILFKKGILLRSSIKAKEQILNSNDSSLINLYKSLKNKRELIAKLYQLSNNELAKKKIKLDSIINQANKIEKEITQKSELFASEFDKNIYKWQDVLNSLKSNEAAIELVRFNYFSKNKFSDSVLYAAFIIKNDIETSNISFVLLENGKELEGKFIRDYKTSIKRFNEDIVSYNQFWQPLAEKLNGIDKVYLSPDGVYNQISMNTLQNPVTGKYLFEELEIQIVGSTKDIVQKNMNQVTKIKSTNVIELFGDPRFILDSAKQELIASAYKKSEINDNPDNGYDSSLTRTGIDSLPGTKDEIENIEKIIKMNDMNLTINKHLGDEALEEAVKNVRYPKILHIATHGLFLDDIEKNTREDKVLGIEKQHLYKNPLLRSMLVFAGAGNSMKGNRKFDGEDGFLTAYEAQNLFLEGTDLVVLSACETGLGEIKNGEGVYGLHRAFQQAGAKTVIMSLWKVRDDATKELMTEFYKNWAKGMTKREAFTTAQKVLVNNYKKPYFWGGFVLIGE